MHKKYVFLDSGIGGLPYFRYFHKKAPQASAAYVADLEHFPYGEKTREEVIKYALGVTEKITVIGNTAHDTSASLMFDCIIKKTVYIIKNTEPAVSGI